MENNTKEKENENKEPIEENTMNEEQSEENEQKKSIIKTIVNQAENYVKAKKDAEEKMKMLKQGAEDAVSGVCFSLLAMHLSQVLFAQMAPVVAIAAAAVPLIYLYGRKQKRIKQQDQSKNKAPVTNEKVVCSF